MEKKSRISYLHKTKRNGHTYKPDMRGAYAVYMCMFVCMQQQQLFVSASVAVESVTIKRVHTSWLRCIYFTGFCACIACFARFACFARICESMDSCICAYVNVGALIAFWVSVFV